MLFSSCIMSCHVTSCYWRISQRATLCSKKVFHVCPQAFRGSNMSANSKAPYTANTQSTNQTAFKKQTNKQTNCSHGLFTYWMTLLSQTNCSWTEWQFSYKLFMNWPMQQPYQTSWTEWHSSHKQTVHGLNDTMVTNRLFMDWIMTLQSQTDFSWTEWYCGHKQTVHGLCYDTAVTKRLFMDWMTLQPQTDCSWTKWYCGHKQTVHGLNYDTAVTNRLFMNWMILWSQTDCSWTVLWYCNHKQTVHGLNDTAVTNKLLMDWMTLQSQTAHGLNYAAVTNRMFMDWIMTLQSQTGCSWTQWWQCSHKQTVPGLTNAAATSDFMNWMMFPQAHSFDNSQNLRPKVLTTVLLRFQVFCDVMLCSWVSGSWNIKASQYLHNIRNCASNHTVSQPRTPEPSIHINFLALLFPESLRVQLFQSNFLFLLSAIQLN